MSTGMPRWTRAPLQPDYVAPRELEHGLTPLSATNARKLVWLQPSILRPAYELWAGECVVGTLRYRGMTQREALGAAADGLWRFEEQEESGQGILIYERGKLVGRVRRETASHEVIILHESFVFHAAPLSLVGGACSVTDVQGVELLRGAPQAEGLPRTELAVRKAARKMPLLSLLLLTCEYLQLSRPAPRAGWLSGRRQPNMG